MQATGDVDPYNSKAPRAFDIVVKLAERCNLACQYCYYFEQKYDSKIHSAIMSDRVSQEIPRFLRRSLNSLNIEAFNVSLHGGEPLLMKKDRFDDLCSRLRAELEPRVELRLTLQTNGVLIDEEWIEIFAKHRIKVGVSIDGRRDLHDAHRPDRVGRGSYDNAVRGLRLLQAAVEQKKLDNLGVITVVHADEQSDDLLSHLIDNLGVHSPNLNFPRGGYDDSFVTQWNSAFENHRKIVKSWLGKFVRPNFHYVREMADVFMALGSDRGAARGDRMAVLRHFIATISSDGDIYIDDNVLGIDDNLSRHPFSIFSSTLRDFIESPIWQELHAAAGSRPAECESCEWFRSCRGGHLYNRYTRAERFTRNSALCDTIKMIHEEMARYLLDNRYVTIDTLATRLSSPATITADSALNALLNFDPVPQYN